jgi:hypothetical protein
MSDVGVNHACICHWSARLTSVLRETKLRVCAYSVLATCWETARLRMPLNRWPKLEQRSETGLGNLGVCWTLGVMPVLFATHLAAPLIAVVVPSAVLYSSVWLLFCFVQL